MNEEFSFHQEEKLYEDFSDARRLSRPPEKSFFHIHSNPEIVLSLTDGLRCRLEDYDTAVPRFHFLLLSPGDLHYFSADRQAGCDRFVFSFSPAFSDTFSTSYTSLLDCFYLRRRKDCHLLPIPQSRLEEFLRLAERITALSTRPYREYGEDLRLRLDYGQFLLSVNSLYLEFHRLLSAVRNTAVNRPLIYRILDYIQIHYRAPIHMETLTRLFSLSRSRLYSDFRAVTGCSPADYILRFRLTKAKEFLAAGHSVEQSGRLAGFSNLAHFSHTFKLRCGICPKQFQKQQNTSAASCRRRQ